MFINLVSEITKKSKYFAFHIFPVGLDASKPGIVIKVYIFTTNIIAN